MRRIRALSSFWRKMCGGLRIAASQLLIVSLREPGLT
jgi:hypothetical protein